VAAAARSIRARRPAGLVIAARGSSDHAGLYGKYLFEIRNRVSVALAAPSALTHYGSGPRLERHCVIGISQSGSSPDVVAVVADARRQGALTVALTNDPASELARQAQHVIPLEAGQELSVPASKTFLATLLALALLSQELDPDPELEAGLGRLPGALEAALELEPRIQDLAAGLGTEHLVVLGRGYQLATAGELALKLLETCYLPAQAYSTADFRHGPIAVADPGLTAILLQSAGPFQADNAQLATELAGLGAQVAVLADGAPTEGAVAFDSGLPEALTPLPMGLAAHLLACHLAVRLGLDPDRPRTLRKITQTW